MKYKLAKFFMYRSTLQCLEPVVRLLNSDDINHICSQLCDNRKLRESIMVASHDFHCYLERFTEGKEQISKKSIRTLLGYLSRIFARATPYGFFAGVTTGRFGDHSEIKIERNSEWKVVQTDAAWLFAVIQKIEMLNDILPQLLIMSSANCYRVGSRYKNAYVSDFGKSKDTRNQSSIKFTKHVEMVMDWATSPILFSELLNKLHDTNPAVPANILFEYLKQLIQSEYLITELRFPILADEPLNTLIEKLALLQLKDESKEYINSLVDIGKLLETCNIDSSLNNLTKLYDQMSKIEKQKDYINGLVQLQPKICTLGENIYKELNDFANMLVVLGGIRHEAPQLVKYKQKFLEKYGDSEVPLLELLDEQLGLGNPYTMHSNDVLPPKQFIENYISSRITAAIKNNEAEIILTDEDCAYIGARMESDIAPISCSFELCVKIVATNEGDLNAGNYRIIIGENVGATKGGAHYNRFYRILNDQARAYLKDFYREIEHLQPNLKLVDAKEMPTRGRASNVVCGTLNMKNTIILGYYWPETGNIPLADIAIGYEKDQHIFYIKSVSQNRLLFVESDNMLNSMGNCQYIRFLRDVSMEYYRHPINCIGFFRKNEGYVPQIRYKNIILMPESWLLTKAVLRSSTYTDFEKDFCRVKRNLGICKFVYLHNVDNMLLLNTENTYCLEYLYHEFMKRQSVRLSKFEYEEPFKVWPDGYASEFIFTFTRNNEVEDPILNTRQNYYSTNASKPVLLPGEHGWIYYKFYLSRGLYKDFIKKLDSLFKSLFTKQLINKAFYLQYNDELDGFHLRVRFQANDNCVHIIMKEIDLWIQAIKEDIYIKKLMIDTYEPEVQRYGGLHAIDHAERVFSIDSLYTSRIIALQDSKNIDDDLIGVFSVLMLLLDFCEEEKEIVNLLNGTVNRMDFKKEYRELKEKLNELQNIPVLLDDIYFSNCLKARSSNVISYRRLLQELDRNGSLANRFENIVFSVVHMFCNRFKGDTHWERKIISIVRHYCYDKVQRSNYSTGGTNNVH